MSKMYCHKLEKMSLLQIPKNIILLNFYRTVIIPQDTTILKKNNENFTKNM